MKKRRTIRRSCTQATVLLFGCVARTAVLRDVKANYSIVNAKLCDVEEYRNGKSNEIILNWCKEHPVKTRQDEFLKMFPNAKIVDGIIGICPKHFETAYACKATKCTCHDCRKSYWLAEVDENE